MNQETMKKKIIITFNGKAGYDATLVCFKYSQNK